MPNAILYVMNKKLNCFETCQISIIKLCLIVLFVFLGTSAKSSHLHLLLRSLCGQICDVISLKRDNIPSEFKDLVAFFDDILKVQPRHTRYTLLCGFFSTGIQFSENCKEV